MRKLTKLKQVCNKLKEVYPEFNFYNKNRVFDEILYIFLSWRTPIVKAESFYQELKAEFPQWNGLLTLSEEDWFKRLESGGKARDKARTIVRLLGKLHNDFGDLDNVETLNEQSDAEVYKYLIYLPGIKDKSAYCIMLYTMKRAVFPADAHCLRVSQRLGVIEGSNERKQDRIAGQWELNQLLRGDYRLCYELHVTMLQHGQKICIRYPRCESCVVSHLCDFYTQQVDNGLLRN